MTKAELILKFKEELAEEGLPMAEDAIIKMLEVTEKIMDEYTASTATKVDDMVMMVAHPIFALMKMKADEIDGAKG
jgi:hypothetical protein